ncbi:MAG: MaoC/PaaZ C-terminal domain-containing protein [Candidatus Binataceae bacterium]|jgi:acyl dehydratase
MSPRRPDAIALEIGAPIPPLERVLTQMRLVAYGAATWDWHRLHYEPEYAAARNIPGPIVDGQMFGALLAEALIDWLGPRAFIRRMSFRLRAMVFAGETVRCEGEVASILAEADCDVVRVTQRVRVGERIAVEPASAEIVLAR